MPDLQPIQKDQLEERRGTNSKVLFWLNARNRVTGDIEAIGLWSGDDHQAFVVDGQTRTYFGAGAMIDEGVVRAGISLDVQYHTFSFPPMLPEVQAATRLYEPRHAPVEVHVLPLDLDSGLPLGTPVRIIRGTVEKLNETLDAKGDSTATVLKIASAARALTIPVPLKKSGAALQERHPNDRGREYSDQVGEWVVRWGGG